ncbi:MAG: nucleotide exchange factor GrpE [bacterium]
MSETKLDETAEADAAPEVQASEAEASADEAVQAAPDAADGDEAEVIEEAELVEEEGPAGGGGLADALAAAQAEAADWRNRAYRAAADLENARRRFTREREDLRKFGTEGMLRDLLPVADNLERALAAVTNQDEPLAKGVQLVLRQFISKVEQYGARPFDPLGEVFDPLQHEAMSELVTSQYAPGHVAQVFQRGWFLHERLVRPAMVLVAKAPEAPAAAAPEGDAEVGDEDGEG